MTRFWRLWFIQTDIAVEADRHFVSAQLRHFNNITSPHHLHIRTNPPQPLDLFVRDADGAIVAALVSDTYGAGSTSTTCGCMKRCAGAAFGARLLGLAESEAQRRGCRHAKLTTFSFQARVLRKVRLSRRRCDGGLSAGRGPTSGCARSSRRT